jgi:hypothetical protein
LFVLHANNIPSSNYDQGFFVGTCKKSDGASSVVQW